jgi:UrcA family protein
MNYGKALAMCGATLTAAIAIGAAASPVHAASSRPLVVVANSEEFVTRRISYADLNLAVAAGERTLNRRIDGAITGVCDDAVGGRSTTFSYRDCNNAAWREAAPQIALAVQRAHEMATIGTSSIATAAITISVAE